LVSKTFQRAVVAIAALTCVGHVHAEIERLAIPGERGMQFYWWPKLAPISGWQHDRDFSLRYSANALAPWGKSFADAETVMYAKAIYKPRVPETKSLTGLIENDKKDFVRNVPGIVIEDAEPLPSGDGKKLISLSYTPKDKGNLERVSYLDEGEFFLVFTISSRSASGLRSSMSAYEKMIAQYREKQESSAKPVTKSNQ
jgi:hypothetical protein